MYNYLLKYLLQTRLILLEVLGASSIVKLDLFTFMHLL